MVRGPAGDLGIDPAKPKLGQIEFIDEDVDHPNRVILANPVFQAFGKQRALSAIHALNEAPHPILPQIASESYRENQIQPRVFTQPGSFASESAEHSGCALPKCSKTGPYAAPGRNLPSKEGRKRQK